MANHQKEKELFHNGQIHVFGRNFSKYLGSFRTYNEFRSRFPGAEIFAYEHMKPGMGSIVYC